MKLDKLTLKKMKEENLKAFLYKRDFSATGIMLMNPDEINISIIKQVTKYKDYDEIWYIIKYNNREISVSRFARLEGIYEELENLRNISYNIIREIKEGDEY